MSLGVIAATRFELERHPRFPGGDPSRGPWEHWSTGGDVFVACGPGPSLAAAGLAWALSLGSVDRVLGIGIAGAFDGSGLGIGSACWVGWESFADLGAEDGDAWLDFPALSLPGLPERNRFALELPAGVAGVGGTTASSVTGSEATADLRRMRTGADVESMEGAAWALTCLRFGVPLLQARGISNRVGRRDRNAWKIGAALDALGGLLGATPGI